MRKILIIAAILFLSACTNGNEKKTNARVYYPQKAWDLRANGHASILYDIDEKGKTGNIRIVDSVPLMMFDKQVTDTVKAWRFEKGNPKKDIPLTVKFER